jgi:hypothetical protein
MVENNTAFESSSSFSLGDSIFSESREGEFEVVSHNDGSDINSGQGPPDRNVYIRNGILILDGAESSSRNDASESVFSVPGTDSLPSDVGTLQDQEVMFPNPEFLKKTWTIPKYSGLLFLSVLCSFMYNAYNWHSSSLKLQQQILEHEATIQRLEKEAEESKMLVDDSDESDYITLVDNCWVKAQARWCDKGIPSTGGFSLPFIVGEAIGEASKIMSKKVSLLKDAMQEIPHSASTEFKAATEAVTQVSDVLSIFVGAAGVAMAAELHEFSGNPLDYVAEAVKGASQNSESQQEANAKGLKEGMHIASSSSKDWSKAFKRTAVKMTELMDDPLSYFEYETN